jgi:hypothetical protein
VPIGCVLVGGRDHRMIGCAGTSQLPFRIDAASDQAAVGTAQHGGNAVFPELQAGQRVGQLDRIE